VCFTFVATIHDHVVSAHGVDSPDQIELRESVEQRVPNGVKALKE